MISVEEALELMEKACEPFSELSCSLRSSFGKILLEDISADRDLPPFDRVMMDGIGISYKSYEAGNRSFEIEGIHGAGQEAPTLSNVNNCFEVMTGAILPIGCDCVIRSEDLDYDASGKVTLKKNVKLKLDQNIHRQGKDYLKGDVLMKKGCHLYAPQIGIAASVGKVELKVSKSPSIALVSNGDELVEVRDAVEKFQIRRSNVYGLESALKLSGFTEVELFHYPDDKNAIAKGLKTQLDHFEVLLMSGGVSMGKFDFIHQVLEDLGVKKVFHKIKQRPGKPFWFGIGPQGQRVFALPGNPVSTLVCFYRYVLPQLMRSCGVELPLQEVELQEDFNFKPAVTYFLPVKIENNQGHLKAIPKATNGSGDYASLALSDGFIQLPADRSDFKAGELYPFFSWGGRF